LRTVAIPKDDEKFGLSKPEEKAKSKIREKNELAFEELVLLIDTSRGDSHVAFQLVCCCKNDDNMNGNAAIAWKQLTAKYAPPLSWNSRPNSSEASCGMQAKIPTSGYWTWSRSKPGLRKSSRTYRMKIL